MQAVIYARISRDVHGEGLGVARQVEDCTRRASLLGWAIRATFVDNDVSASKAVPRPEYARLLDEIRAGKVQAVVVYDLDRLTRKPAELEGFIDLANAHNLALANVSGDVDLTTANGKMVARIKGAVARQEADRISERTARQKAQALADGRALGGRFRLFGYNRDWTVNEEEAAVVRQVFTRARVGESYASITRDLKERDVRTVTGGVWRLQQTTRLLRTQRYAGRSVHHGRVVGNSQVTPLVAEADFEAVQKPTPSKAKGVGRKYLLSGFLVCGVCRATMTGSTGRYRCDAAMGGCGKVGIKSDWVDHPIAMRISSLHQQVRYDEPFESTDYAAQIAEIDGRITSLHKNHQTGDLEMEDLLPLLKEERRRRRELLAAAAQDTSAMDRILRGIDEFQLADISVQRELVYRYLKYIVIAPSGKGRQPYQSRGRVTVTWKNGSNENLLTDTPRLDYRSVL